MLVENPQTEKERLLDTGTRRESDVENHSAIKPKKKMRKDVSQEHFEIKKIDERIYNNTQKRKKKY